MSRHGQATLSSANARDQLSDILNRAAFGKERVVVSRRGKPLAAVVPLEDIATLEALEDALDAAEIQKRLLEWEAAGKPGIPLEEVAIRLGVKL